MAFSEKEIQILRTARTNIEVAVQTSNKMDIGLTVEIILDLGYHVLLLFVSEEVFNQKISE